MKVVVGSKTCTKCHQLKRKLEENGEEFKYVDISELDTDDIRTLGEKFGLNLPIVYDEVE